jgi:putative two-component system response regulator
LTPWDEGPEHHKKRKRATDEKRKRFGDVDNLQEIKFYCSIFDRFDSSFTYKKKYLRPDGSVFSMVIKAVAIDFRPRHRRHIVIVYDVDIESRRNEVNRLKLASMESKNAMQTSHVSRDAVINALVSLSMFRDRETGEHLYRTKLYVYTLLRLCLHRIPLSDYGRLIVANASMLHDIGKVGIPDAILLKKGKLDVEEMNMIKNHTSLGVKALHESLVNTGYDVSLLFARDIVMFHHERWDGKGYPCGLSGEEIPFLARVMAIADVYDALRSERPYKQALSHETSVNIIVSEKGSHFDPCLVDLFQENNGMFDVISKKKVDNTFS